MTSTSELTFAELQKLRKDGSDTRTELQVRKKMAEESSSETMNSNKPKKKKKKNKGPPELSSKVPVSVFREVIHAKKPKGIDPRFNPLSGKFNEDLFRKSYAFLDDLKREEVQRLREELQEATSEERRDMIRRAIQIQEQRLREQAKKDELKRMKQELKRKERERVARGKKPFYFKRDFVKKMALEKKYEELKSKNQLEKFMEKKRRREAAKDRKLMPAERIPASVKQQKHKKHRTAE